MNREKTQDSLTILWPVSEDFVLESEGQLCWTGTVRRPGGQLLGGGWW